MPDVRFRLSPVAAMVAAALAPGAATAVTYTVTNTADSGAGSLRAAMTSATGNCGTDTAPIIDFAIPGTGPFTIAPSSPLPSMTCLGPFTPTIDGTTQSGWAANTDPVGFNGTFGIVLSGAAFGSPGCGLHLLDPGNYGGQLTVQGLEVRQFAYAGVGQALCGFLRLYGNRVVHNTTGVAIGSNSVLTSVVGDTAPDQRNVISENTSVGITVSYGGSVLIKGNFIGTPDGSSPGAITQPTGIGWGGAPVGSGIANNVISGNTTGVSFSSDNAASITGNLFGTNAAGTAALPNALGLSGSSLNGTSITGNVFSGNTGNGAALQNVGGVAFNGNKIGLVLSGNTAIPNGSDGVFIQCGNGITISGNNFSGNVANGLTIASVDNVDFNGNRVGVAPDGSPLANGDSGLLLAAGACPQYGSNGVFSGNMILNNGVDGIALTSPLGVGNRITQNSIYANGNKNININNTVGPLPNDPNDPDAGPNLQQNYPVITLVTQSGGNTSVNWTFNSTPGSTFTFEFFENPATGTPAGKIYLATLASVATNASGNASGTTPLSGLHDFISMTATDPANNTSEFSAIVAVTPTPAVTITPPALAFGNVVVGTTSPPQISTLTSSGTAPYTITTFDTAATCYGAPLCYGGPFTCSTNCTTGTPYAPSASCTITASFAPLVLGPQSSTIYICDNAAGSPHTITLSGTAVAPPPINVSPSSQDFGSIPVGSSSIPIIFNFSNPSATAPAPISAPSVTGPFQIVGTTCGAAIPPSSSCNVNVVFTPTAPGLASGALSMTSGTGTATAGLAGTGTTAPLLVLPPPIDLGGVIVGSPVSRTVTLTNTGAGPLQFSSITVSAPFTLVNNCPATLPAGQSCTLVIGADTRTVGTFNGTLTIVSDGGSGTVPLTVNVQQLPIPILRITPTTVGFGDRIVGSASASQRITILNEGGAVATITGVTPSPDYIVTGNSCGTNLAPNASCFVDVAMRAVGFGMRVGQLVIGSNATGAPHAVNLAGTGCRPFSATGVRTGPRSNCR